MRQLLRTIIFAILIVGVITKTELSVSTNKANNEHTISLNKKPIVAEFDEELVGAITQNKTSVSTNKTNDEHISLDIKSNIIKDQFSPDAVKLFVKMLHTLYGILGFAAAIFTLTVYRYYCYPCEQCQDWILRFFRPTHPAEMPVREREVEFLQMPQRQEEVHNLPPNVIESHL